MNIYTYILFFQLFFVIYIFFGIDDIVLSVELREGETLFGMFVSAIDNGSYILFIVVGDDLCCCRRSDS